MSRVNEDSANRVEFPWVWHSGIETDKWFMFGPVVHTSTGPLPSLLLLLTTGGSPGFSLLENSPWRRWCERGQQMFAVGGRTHTNTHIYIYICNQWYFVI